MGQSSLSDPAANSEQPGNAMADGNHVVQEEPQRHAEELNIIRCNECGAGPWSSRRALRAHQIRKHGYRHALQAAACPNCGRQFTTKSAARRHVQHQSCHKPVNNHGHAGAIAGQLIARTHAAAKAQATPLSPVRAQASERSIADFFARRNGWHGLLEGRPSQPNQSAVQTWADSAVMAQMEQWKQQLPQRGQAHPQGPACLTVAAAVAKWILNDADRKLASYAQIYGIA